MTTNYETIVGMSYNYFAQNQCTPEKLMEFVRRMMAAYADTELDQDKLYAQLERIHAVTIPGTSSVLEDHEDHGEWFNSSLNECLNREIDWHFWPHYRDYLTSEKNWAKGIVDSIDRETSAVLCRLEDPKREGRWDRRGMVMGSVQSGKTANYTGLITKAIDTGYQLIMVLAGVHNSLRSQTQYRLNEEVLGYNLDKVQEFRGLATRIGVRALFKDHRIVQTLTSSNESGDFKKKVAEQAGIVPTPNGPAIIMIVKKQVSILKNLINWAASIIGVEDSSGRRFVMDVPLLVIDDECDFASVNTNKVVRDENGVIDKDCDPAKTNMRIRELLTSFYKSSYVGYTATPFANIFIHYEGRHPRYGEDLFPRNFIVSLPQPTNYIGPERVFGLSDNPAVGIEGQEPLPLVRNIEDSEEIIPGKHKKDLVIGGLPDSLKEAIKSFLICCAVRRLRSVSPPHDSMLVHITRFTRVQEQVQDLIQKELRRCVDRIRNKSDSLDDFKNLWETDFVRTAKLMNSDFGCPTHVWDDVVENLYPVARRIRVKTINGTAKDSLEYRDSDMDTRRKIAKGETVPWEERGEHVIAVGGDKLSRGLTLDGLTISYYLRASRMYDTLMQMGRWFGYRDGYEDLCRIYTTPELSEWYRFIATASLELKHELDYMALIGEEPKNFGLKVLSHPGQLAVTSAGKRRNAETLDLSYSGRISETVVFDLSQSKKNREALLELCRAVPREKKPGESTKSAALYRTGIPPEVIVRFLNTYRTRDQAARVVDPGKIAMFIDEQQKYGDNDLTTWDVALISRQEDPLHSFRIDETEVRCVERRPLILEGTKLTIKRLVSPSDEWIDFSEEEKKQARDNWNSLRSQKGKEPGEPGGLPSGPAIRAARPKERGLLLIYTICCNKEGKFYGMEEGQEVIGFAVSFPGSNTTRQVTYEVNSVFQDAED